MRAADLTPAERRVWEAFPRGERVDFRLGDPDDPGADLPESAASWGPDRTIRADVLKALLLDRGKSGALLAALRITGARITGRLDLMHAEYRQRVSFVGCHFEERVMFFGCRTRRTSFRDSVLAGGLNLARAVVDGDVRLDRSRIHGGVRLDGTEIAGVLLADGAALIHPGATALNADRLKVGDEALFRDGFTAQGSITLRGAAIGGTLDFTGAALANPGGTVLDAARIHVDADFLADRLVTQGEFRLPGATVAGLLRLVGARLSAPDGTALYAYQTKIGADLQCHEGFEAEGDIRLTGAHITGHARFDQARLTSHGLAAVDGRYCQIDGSAEFRSATVVGPLRFYSARIGSSLSLHKATLTTDTGAPVLYCGRLRAADLDLHFATPPNGDVVLTRAELGALSDDPATWPPRLYLEGLAYDRLTDPGTLRQRVAWLGRNATGYQPGPYEHLAAAYRRVGLDDDARRVLLAKQRARRRTLPVAARPWGMVQDAAVGYGYRPGLALAWLALFLAVGTTVFAAHPPTPAGPPPAPRFNALVYSLDLLLPVINFGQGKAFLAEGGYQWLAYALTGVGWLLATTIAAGLARAVNRA